MVAKCPKCSHVRTAADSGVPDWQCPRCGIAYAKFADGAPLATRALAPSTTPSSSVSLIAACILIVVAAFGYYIYDKHAKPSAFVEGERLEAGNPAFYGTKERGGPVLRITPVTAIGLAEISSSAQVVMFATSWCPYCAQARALLEKKKVRYTELDIERNEQAKDFLERVMGLRGFPTIVIGNRVTLGFSEENILASLREL